MVLKYDTVAALPPLRPVALALLAILLLGALPSPASAALQSWNGYRWSRTGPLAINLGNNLDSIWALRLVPTAAQWSLANNIDFVPAAGRATSSACGAVYGSVQVCNSDYGKNGWLGYTNVWLSNGFIVQATVRINDYYFGQARYNTDAWRQTTLCHELGHTLGLAHTNTSRTNANTGSCMDYTNDPAGTAGGSNGTLANTAPNAVDFTALDSIYANLDTTQLSYTRPQVRLGSGFGIDSFDRESFAFVPEPSSWALLVIGFGTIGATMRRHRRRAVTA